MPRAELHGRVVDANDEPCAGIRVRLARDDAPQVVRAGVKDATEFNLLATLR